MINLLLSILKNQFTHRIAIHTDISKMYNTICLNKSDWCYHRYIWIYLASLPFTSDPSKRLANKKNKAMKVYNQQLRKLNLPDNVKDKQDIIDSEGKLHQLGYINYLKNLPDLDPSKIPDEKFIKTLIYSVCSSGNQAEFGLRKVAELSKEEYPEVN